MLDHKEAIISHLSWVSLFLGFHTLGLYVHNDVVVAFGQPEKQILVEPVFAQFIQAASGKTLYGFDTLLSANNSAAISASEQLWLPNWLEAINNNKNFNCKVTTCCDAPIGSGLGIQNKVNIRIIRSQTKLPLIIDAGIGQASDASIAMELGCDGVLINTAIAKAKNPILMAKSMKHAVLAGRQSYLAGRMALQKYGSASSPKKGLI